MKALIINCTLKRSPEFSNTGALAEKAMKLLEENRLEVEPDMVRLVDYDIKPGTASDMKDGDEWPEILEKIKKCDIFIIATPIYMGYPSSVAQRVIERLNAVLYEKNMKNEGNGQYITYNKVAGCLVTGNRDGAHNCVAQVLWSLQELGFTIPPNANAYWEGMAGNDKSYAEAGGRKNFYTNYTLRRMADNLVYFAKILRAYPITNNLAQLEQLAKDESDMLVEKQESDENTSDNGNNEKGNEVQAQPDKGAAQKKDELKDQPKEEKKSEEKDKNKRKNEKRKKQKSPK